MSLALLEGLAIKEREWTGRAKEILARRGILATDLEARIYLWLESRGYSEADGSMQFQSSLWGGRQMTGGLEQDFLLRTPSPLYIWALGDWWHKDPVQQNKDAENKARVEAATGIPVIRVRERHIYIALDRVMEDAIQGIEWEQND